MENIFSSNKDVKYSSNVAIRVYNNNCIGNIINPIILLNRKTNNAPKPYIGIKGPYKKPEFENFFIFIDQKVDSIIQPAKEQIIKKK